jgi:hypothetical protein
LRALAVRQVSCGPTSDQYAERIKLCRFGPFEHLWPDATSVSRRSIVLRYLHRWCYAQGVGVSNTNKRSCFYELQGLALNGWENQTDRNLKFLWSDNRGKYKSNEVVQFHRKHNIRRKYTAPYSPEQMGVAEWMNWTIQERIIYVLHHSGHADGFWAEALLTAVHIIMHIINMSPSKPLGSKIPQDLWIGRKIDYRKLRIFGCEAYLLVLQDECCKLKSRSRKYIFLGYGPNGNFGYRLWDLESHQVIRSSDVVFHESAMHKAVECPIELWRVTFADVFSCLDGPTQHTRLASRSANCFSMERVVPAQNPSSIATTDLASSAEPSSNVWSTTVPQLASLVIPRRSKRLSQPLERYSPGLFFTDTN